MQTRGQVTAELSKAIIKFERGHMGRGPKEVQTHLVNDMVVIRLKGVLTAAEHKLARNNEGIDLIKRVRSNLLEHSRSLLEEIIFEILGTRVISMHTDISTKTGDRVIIFMVEENLEQKYPCSSKEKRIK